MNEAILSTSGLGRQFGGLAAVDGLSLEFHMRQIHAVIGPNGAGKSTFINLLSGDLTPSTGTVRFEGSDITGLSSDRISQLGIGRSYQKTNIFADFTAFENCRLAAQARLVSSMRFFRPALRLARVNDAAGAALESVGLAGRADIAASALSHGEQRQLEIAMVLATGPKVLLLDEPLAGMGAEESALMVALLGRLAREHAIVLVEHDMDAVFQLADRLSVMVNGRLLESGTPDEIRSSPAVQDAYLGTAEHD